MTHAPPAQSSHCSTQLRYYRDQPVARVECKGTRVADVKMMRDPMDSVNACSSKSPRMLFNAKLAVSSDQIHSQSAGEYCLGCEH